MHKIVVELCERLKHETSEKDKYRSLLRELLEAQRNRKSEQLSKDQLALFETLWKARHPDEEEARKRTPNRPPKRKPSRRNRRPRSAAGGSRWRGIWSGSGWCTIWRNRRSTATGCGKDLQLIGEETSERYEFIPAVMKVIEDVRLKYACDCTVKGGGQTGAAD